MSILTKGADLIYTYRFLRLLTQDWKKTKAYQLGIIDDEGNPLKKVRDLKTNNEKKAYTIFHRLVFRIKRSAARIPFGNLAINSLAAATLLLKDNYNVVLQDDNLSVIQEENTGNPIHVKNGDVYRLESSSAITIDYEPFEEKCDVKIIGEYKHVYIAEAQNENHDLLFVSSNELVETTSTAGGVTGATPHLRKFVLPPKDYDQFKPLMKRNRLDSKFLPESPVDQLVVENEITGDIKYVKVYD